MAKVIRKRADEAKVLILLEKYKSKNKSYADIIEEYKKFLREELLKTTEKICPFCGAFADYSFSIEHFKPKGDKRYIQLQLEWENLYPCLRNVNTSTKFDENNPPFDPVEINYPDKIELNSKMDSYVPKNSDDKQAIETIRKYSLEKNEDLIAGISNYYSWRSEGKFKKGEKYPFYEYIEPLFQY